MIDIRSRAAKGRAVAVAAGLAVAVAAPPMAAPGAAGPAAVSRGSAAVDQSVTGAAGATAAAWRQDPICEVGYLVRAWTRGLRATVTITNTSGERINGWSLTFRLPGGQTIVGARGARYSPPSGTVMASDVGYNAEVEPGESVSIEFLITTAGSRAVPGQFAVNGNVCATSPAGSV